MTTTPLAPLSTVGLTADAKTSAVVLRASCMIPRENLERLTDPLGGIETAQASLHEQLTKHLDANELRPVSLVVEEIEWCREAPDGGDYEYHPEEVDGWELVYVAAFVAVDPAGLSA